MGLRFSGRTRRRVRAALALIALLIAALVAFFASPLALPAILVAAAALLWERAALAAELRDLAAVVAAAAQQAATPAADDLKLEVADGAWGELCHALNRLLQQRRAELQLRTMLPALPLAGAARLAELRTPSGGLPCEVAVLTITHPATADVVTAMRETAYVAFHHAQLYDALLARWGEGVILIFGVLGQQDSSAALRSAYQSARAIVAAWASAPTTQRPRLTLAGGNGQAVILPGLGLTVVGAPMDQALALQGLAPGAPLVCNEEAYLGLRRLGVIPPLEPPRAGRPTARLPVAEGRPAAFTVPL